MHSRRTHSQMLKNHESIVSETCTFWQSRKTTNMAYYSDLLRARILFFLGVIVFKVEPEEQGISCLQKEWPFHLCNLLVCRQWHLHLALRARHSTTIARKMVGLRIKANRLDQQQDQDQVRRRHLTRSFRRQHHVAQHRRLAHSSSLLAREILV